jgi:formylglycine-generating enzyme required for sulfatase activity
MPVYTGTSGKTYQADDAPFASGGEGSIHDIAGNRELVAKIYNPDKRTTERERKVSAMSGIKPSVIEQYAWPLDPLYENGAFAGYVMPKVTGKEKLRNIYVYDNRAGIPWTLYIAIAKNLAAAVHNVHEIGQIIGDLNPENILADPHTGLVTLVDTDSYHITDSKGTVYRCMVGMPEFVAPELQGQHFPSAPLPTFTKQSDEFALSVLIFALLMNGAHPFACKTITGSASQFQPIDNMVSGLCAHFAETTTSNLDIPRYAPELSSLPLDIQSLFHRAFVDGYKKTDFRPTAEEWYHALDRLENNIKSCGTNPAHLYYSRTSGCPWCKVDQKMSLSLPQPKSPLPQTAFTSASATQPPLGGQAAPLKKKGKTNWIAIAAIVGVVVLIAVLRDVISTNNATSPPPVPSATTVEQSTPEASILEGFVKINGGTFMMGSPASEVSRDSDEVQHQVTVSNFFMGKYEVTQKEWVALMGTNPSDFKGDNLPVENVSWYDAVEYCNARSRKEGLTPAYTISGSGNNRTVTWNRNANGYRLPTEAEWEYACRVGTTTPFYTGNNITTNQANYDGDYPYNRNAKGTYRGKTTAVGSFAANAWGLYDLHGNVWEWCWDWYGGYSSNAQTDPVGASSGAYRVLRGGSWDGYGQVLRSAFRDYGTPSGRDNYLGFRLARPSL